MKEDDIDIFIKAKDKFSYGNIIYLVATILVAMAASSALIPSFQEYTKYLVLSALFIGASTYGVRSRSYVTRHQLLNVLERQVNLNPKALEYNAKKSSANVNTSAEQVMNKESKIRPLVLEPNEGRSYPMGRMSAVFKADLDETDSTLSVSEWWLEPNTEGPHIHKHPEAHLFYVIEGNLAVYLQGKNWFELEKGSYIFIPGETEHGFENRSNAAVGFMSINTPGGFEQAMPHIANYFEENPLGDAR